MNNIQRVSDAMLCSNCGACKAVCPKDAITYKQSALGRMYAEVNDNCVHCSMCVSVCPSLNLPVQVESADRYLGQVKAVYVGRATDPHIYQNAQSGGACTAVLSYLFDTKAIDCALVTKMSYGKPPKVEAVLVTSKEQLSETQKSCYTPVAVLSQLRNTKAYKSVAVVGLPCQIQALTNMMSKSKAYANISYKLGLVCERTLCGKIQDVLLSYVEDGEYKIDWKRKDFSEAGVYYPYKTAPVVVYNNITSRGGGTNVMPNSYRFALKDVFTSPRCRVCFDKLNVCADLVFGDPWGMSGVDWNRGGSLLIARTERGENMVDASKRAGVLELVEHDIAEVAKGQLVAQRKRQVAVYSRALCDLPNQIESYLYKQNTGEQCSKSSIKKASSEFKDFMALETKSSEEIIQIARGRVQEYCRKIKRDQSPAHKLYRKIKQFVRKIIAP